MSTTSAKPRLGLKLIAALVIAGAGVYAAIALLRPAAVVEPVVAGDALDAKTGSVTVVEEYSEELKSELAGRVLDKDFKLSPGEIVKKGEILAQLDPADLQLAIDKEKIDFQAKKATFAADHTKELQLESANDHLINNERLNKLGAFADADLAEAKRGVKALEQGIALERIDRQQILDTFDNTLKVDERKLQKMTITAPFDGTVSVVNAHPGDLVVSSESVATLITTNKLVEGKISEEDFAKVRVGEEAVVNFIPYGSWLFKGKVTKILPTADPDTQRHVVYLDVEVDPGHPISPGINGEVSIVVDRHAANAIVPRRAVFSHNGDCVYVVRDGRVEERKVKKGFEWTTGAEITEGLAPGETVLVDRLQEFHPGEKVGAERLPSDALKHP